jgi:hypothetical protein
LFDNVEEPLMRALVALEFPMPVRVTRVNKHAVVGENCQIIRSLSASLYRLVLELPRAELLQRATDDQFQEGLRELASFLERAAERLTRLRRHGSHIPIEEPTDTARLARG